MDRLTPLADVVSAVRTPIGRFMGSLAQRSAVDLGEIALREGLVRAQVAPDQVDACYLGNARPAGNGPNPARQVAIRAGLSHDVRAMTVNMACGSGLQTLILGVQDIALGRAEYVAVGGFESMSTVPYLLPKARSGYRMGHAPLVDAMVQDGFHCPLANQVMGATAETLAREYGISRQEQDGFALESQMRAARAVADGLFQDEMVVVAAQGKRPGLDHDEHPRSTSLEKLAKLPAVFDEQGTVSAGNSSGLTDAASVIILRRHDPGSSALAHVLDYEVAGVDPARMGIGPVPATRRLLARTGVGLKQIDAIELNEAFAAQVLACVHDLKLPLERLNTRGGAIALGHPIAATGARITTTLLHQLAQRDLALGLATLCVSGGLGVSVLFRNALN